MVMILTMLYHCYKFLSLPLSKWFL
jgi:hypothetical protein